MSGGVRLAGLIAALAMLLTACSQVVQGTAEPADAGPEQDGDGEYQEAPSDRDPEKVSSALREIDPCKLLDADLTDEHDSLMVHGPHSCLLNPEEEYSPGDDSIRATVGTRFEHSDRYLLEPVTIGDATAYERREYNDTVHDCWLEIPVSFTHAIEFKYDDYDNGDACGVLHEQAETAVEKLRDPDVLLSEEGPPLSEWDGCLLLQTALGDQAEQYDYEPNGAFDPFSGCQLRSEEHVGLDAPALKVQYTDGMHDGDETVEVAGTDVEVDKGSPCTLSWEADSEVENEWFDTMLAELKAGSCEDAAELAGEVLPLMEESPPPQAEPQHPLVYDSDEPDTEVSGACQHFAAGDEEECRQHQDADMPDDSDQILNAALEDPAVQCALFEDAVEQAFGSEMEALTYKEFCYFVEPTHTLRVEASVAQGPKAAPAQLGDNEELHADREATEIAGWSSVTFYDSSHEKYDVYLSPYDDIEQPGHVHIGVEALAGRGDTRAEPDPDSDELEQADEVMAEVVQQYLE